MVRDAHTVVVAVSNDDVLHKNLLRSPWPAQGGGVQLILQKGFRSASVAYNAAIDEAVNDVIVFVHQDIYLPEGWLGSLNDCIEALEVARVRWGVLGCYGVRHGSEEGRGRVYTTGIGRHGRHLEQPEPVDTLDEIVLVIRKSSSLRFDENLPHFHFYGSDICLLASSLGMTNYAFQAYCVHNTNQLLVLPPEFYECYWYMRRKWADRLPIRTSCTTVSLLGASLYYRRLKEVALRLSGRAGQAVRRVEDPRVFAEGLDIAQLP